MAEPPVPVPASLRLVTEYNDWNYFMGAALSGMLRAADASGEPRYREYVLRNFRFIFDHLDTFHEQWEVQQVARLEEADRKRVRQQVERHLLAHPGVEVRVRVPLVPGLTATEENLAAIVAVLCELRAPSVSLLPWNPMGLAMAERLGRPRPPLPPTFMSREEEDRLGDLMAALIADRQREPVRLDRPKST